MTIWDRFLAMFREQPAPLVVAVPGVEFHDRRKLAAQSHHGYPVKRRKLSAVTGICLHQTACHLGERPSRYDGMGAHIGVTREGRVIWLHDFDKRVTAANGFNDSTVSIEIDGLYAGVEADQRTVWDNPSTPLREQGMILTPAAVIAAQQAVRWIVTDVARRGGAIKQIVAHRQSSATRRSDPGEAIWKSVALVAMAELGLSDGGVGFKLGGGLPIPEAWDPRAKGIRY